MDPTKWQGVMVDGQKFSKSDSNPNLLIIPDFSAYYLSKKTYQLLRPMGNFKTVECLIGFFGSGIYPLITANSQVVQLNTGTSLSDFGVYKIILKSTNIGQMFNVGVSYQTTDRFSHDTTVTFLLTQNDLTFSTEKAAMSTSFLGAYATY
jgi:hypothetical protein